MKQQVELLGSFRKMTYTSNHSGQAARIKSRKGGYLCIKGITFGGPALD